MSAAYMLSLVRHVIFFWRTAVYRGAGITLSPVISSYASWVHVMPKGGFSNWFLCVLVFSAVGEKNKTKKETRSYAKHTALMCSPQNPGPSLDALQDMSDLQCRYRTYACGPFLCIGYTMNVIFHMAFVTQCVIRNILGLQCEGHYALL